jgi:hypothetical protein
MGELLMRHYAFTAGPRLDHPRLAGSPVVRAPTVRNLRRAKLQVGGARHIGQEHEDLMKQS